MPCIMHFRIFLILFFLGFSSCGIETPQALPKLFAPNGVVILEGENTPSRTITVSWFGSNPEEHFSGYNIYYATDRNDALNLRGRRIPNSAVNSTDATYIVTLPFYNVQEFNFVFNRDNHGSVIQNDLRNAPTVYIWVRAYSKIQGIESEASRFAKGQFD
ncbi:MAG: hypothetical protein ACRCS8_03485 [Brevinema sp.]